MHKNIHTYNTCMHTHTHRYVCKKTSIFDQKQERHFSHCVRKGSVPSRCNFTEKITLQKMSQKCPP